MLRFGRLEAFAAVVQQEFEQGRDVQQVVSDSVGSGLQLGVDVVEPARRSDARDHALGGTKHDTSEKVRAARGEGDPIDTKDVDRIIAELPASVDAAFQCVSMMARSVTPEHAKTLSNSISGCYAHAGAALACFDAIML